MRDDRTRGYLLVVDDDATIRRLMGDVLQWLGHSAVIVGDADAAVARFVEARDTSQPFDAVLTDLYLGGDDDGASLLRRLRSLEPTLPAVVFTGNPEAAPASDYEAYGFQARLGKPFRLNELDAAVESVLHY